MGNLNFPELKTFGHIARTCAWAGALGAAYGGWALTTAHIAGAAGIVAGVAVGAGGLILGAAAGFGVAIPVAITALIGRDIIRKKLFPKKPQPAAAPAPQTPQPASPPAPVAQVVKQSLEDAKSIAQAFNGEAAIELADDITFRKLKLNVNRKRDAAPKA